MENYIDGMCSEEETCPYCEEEDCLSWGQSYIEDGLYVQEYVCDNCGTNGELLYELIFVGHHYYTDF